MIEAVRKVTEQMPSYSRTQVRDGVLYARTNMQTSGMPEGFLQALQRDLIEQRLTDIPATYLTGGKRANDQMIRKITIAGVDLTLKKSRYSKEDIKQSPRATRRFNNRRGINDYFTELYTLFEAKDMYRKNPLPGNPELLTEEPLAVYAQSNGDYWTIFPHYETEDIDLLSAEYNNAKELGWAQCRKLTQLGFIWIDPQFIITKRQNGKLEPRLIDFEFLYNLKGVVTPHNPEYEML